MTQSNAFTGGTNSVAPTTQIPREQRAKLPAGQGVWPAIWMLPTDEEYGTWASSGEIDIMEFHILLNLAIGGGFVGNVDASTKFPREFLIDYVRVHQR